MADNGATMADARPHRDGRHRPRRRPADDLAEDVLVEEVSIDGMCGVY